MKFNSTDTHMFTKEEYLTRRKGLEKIIGNGLLLFLGNEESSINCKDNWYPFRQDSTFLYFFGLNQPGLAAVVDLDDNQEIIFGDDLSIDDVVFNGPLPSLNDLADEKGITKVLPSLELSKYVERAIDSGRQIHFIPPYRGEQLLKLSSLLKFSTTEIARNHSVELIKAIVTLRSIKSDSEVVEIEKAVNITVDMHYRAMEIAARGMIEADLFGAVSDIALSKGKGTSFPPIVTVNGQILHNHYRGNTLKSGDMVLCDCGAEISSNYAGDLTRTFPVDKKFTTRQKEIYDIVHSAYEKGVSELRPGRLFKDIHLAVCKKIVEGLIQQGLMKGNPQKAVDQGAHTVFFQCGLGHMMGLDVHDMENLGEQYVGYTDNLKQSTEFGLKSLRLGRALEEGMVLTVEPGIYFIPELIELRKSQKRFNDFINYEKLESYKDFGGIRIEDDFLIIANGARLLGNRLPTTAVEIEEFRASKIKY